MTGLVRLLAAFALAQPALPAADSPTAEKRVPAVVETTLATDGSKIRQFAFDGKEDSYFASTKPPTADDHFTLTFDTVVTVTSVAVATGKPAGGDELAAGVLEGSEDGKTFEALATFADGKVSATPKKKLKAIRVKAAGEAKAPLVLREFALATEPPVGTFHYPVEIAPDATDAPELKEWLADVAKVCEKQYPMICTELKSDGFSPPRQISMTLKKDYDGVAYAAGAKIVGSVKYFTSHKADVGAFVHETAHCVQAYRGRGNPGWLVEGVADYVRFFKYEPKKPAKLPAAKAKFNGSYRTTAAFLDYLVETHDKDIVNKLNEKMRAGKFAETTWKDLTGKTAEELGREWQLSLEK